MLKEDADIDALMGSVLGASGEPAIFPERALGDATRVVSITSAKGKRSKRSASQDEAVGQLSGELAEQLVENETERAFIDPRTVPVRFSNLKHMARSPLHYLDAVQLDRDDTLAMRLGRGAHAMVLGMPVVKWTGKTRQGKVWEAFRAKHTPTGAEILNAKEWAKAQGMADAIKRHPIATDLLLADSVIREAQFEWEWLGRRCSSRPDARSADGLIVTDFKTTQCAEPQKFQRDASYRAYNAQLAYYALAVKHLTGTEPTDLFAVAVESKRPYPVTVLRLDDGARLQGEKLCRLWMERLLTCEASNHWPAYTDAVVAFSVPSDGDPNAAIDVDELEDDDPAWA